MVKVNKNYRKLRKIDGFCQAKKPPQNPLAPGALPAGRGEHPILIFIDKLLISY
ncbi:MAG: hypothetical protein WAK57_12110 [Desulfobacterales bacterium]